MGVPWRQVPEIYGKWQTVYSRFKRWSEKGVFAGIFKEVADKNNEPKIIMIDSTFSKSHRTSASMAYDGQPRQIGRSRGGLTTKIHVLCDENRMPIDFCITNGEVHDVKAGYDLVRANRHRIKTLIADKAYDSGSMRQILAENNSESCIPSSARRNHPFPFDTALYRKRHLIENMLSVLKDWRGVAMRYCRNAHSFFSFVTIALLCSFVYAN